MILRMRALEVVDPKTTTVENTRALVAVLGRVLGQQPVLGQTPILGRVLVLIPDLVLERRATPVLRRLLALVPGLVLERRVTPTLTQMLDHPTLERELGLALVQQAQVVGLEMLKVPDLVELVLELMQKRGQLTQQPLGVERQVRGQDLDSGLDSAVKRKREKMTAMDRIRMESNCQTFCERSSSPTFPPIIK